jgi:anaerobic ribonucleoside-triphosphate reductase activating protein
MTSIPIALSRVHYPVRTLGPGLRLGIWFQGCSIRCAGCISLDTWAQKPPEATVDSVLAGISSWLGHADGVTISGGEPFDQADALYELLSRLRSPDKDILVFSGYAVEELDLSRFAGLIDTLIADPFVIDQPQTLALRGSDNQRLVCLTALGRARMGRFERAASGKDRTLDLMFSGDEVYLAGIPGRGDLARLRQILADQGHQVNTTEDERTT